MRLPPHRVCAPVRGTAVTCKRAPRFLAPAARAAPRCDPPPARGLGSAAAPPLLRERQACAHGSDFASAGLQRSQTTGGTGTTQNTRGVRRRVVALGLRACRACAAQGERRTGGPEAELLSCVPCARRVEPPHALHAGPGGEPQAAEPARGAPHRFVAAAPSHGAWRSRTSQASAGGPPPRACCADLGLGQGGA